MSRSTWRAPRDHASSCICRHPGGAPGVTAHPASARCSSRRTRCHGECQAHRVANQVHHVMAGFPKNFGFFHQTHCQCILLLKIDMTHHMGFPEKHFEILRNTTMATSLYHVPRGTHYLFISFDLNLIMNFEFSKWLPSSPPSRL